MDFAKYGLEGDQLAQAQSDYTADVLGLKSKNSDLIQREKDVKGELESSKIAAEQAKHDQAKSLAEKDGSIADYKIALDNEKEQMTLLKHGFQESENKRLLESSVNDFSSVLADDPAGRMYMQSQFNSMVEVKDGVVVSKDTTKTIEDLKQSLVSDKANANYIKANVGSGAGSAGSVSDGSSVTNANLNDVDKARALRAERRNQKFNKTN
jgi:hypothetical protein